MIFSKPHRRYDPVAEIEDYEDYYSGIELTEEQEHKVRQLVHENLPKILHDSYLVLCEETIAIVEEDMKEFLEEIPEVFLRYLMDNLGIVFQEPWQEDLEKNIFTNSKCTDAVKNVDTFLELMIKQGITIRYASDDADEYFDFRKEILHHFRFLLTKRKDSKNAVSEL